VAKFEAKAGTQINDEFGLGHAGDDLPGLKRTARLLDLGRAGAFSDAAILQRNRRTDERQAHQLSLCAAMGKKRLNAGSDVRFTPKSGHVRCN